MSAPERGLFISGACMDPKETAAAAAAPGAAAGEKKQDFEGAFSEFAQAKQHPESASTDAKADAAAAASESKDATPAAADPAKAPVAGESAKGAAAAAAPATVDPWKDAPQALRDAHERALADERTARARAEQQARSAEGRYKAAISKTSDIERKHSAGAASAAAPAAQPAAAAPAASAAPAHAAARPAPASGGEAAAPAQAAEMPPEWKQLQETLPDVAKAVEARFGAVDQAVREALAAVKPLQEDVAVRFKREQGALLTEAYPGWNSAVMAPEFAAWIKQQPQSVRELAKSDYAADNAALLEYYGYQPPEDKPQPPVQQQAPGGKTATQIQAERDQRLERGTSVRGSAQQQPLADAPDSFEAAFAFYARKRQEAARRAA